MGSVRKRRVPRALDRGERERHEVAERENALAPEASLRRRDFLARTASLAGATGLAGVLPTETLVAAAARVQRRRALPSPRNMPLDTIVVLMMENRSFDHYLGWYDKADGRNEGMRFPSPYGGLVPTHHLTPDFQGCAFKDPDHSWWGGRFQLNGGRNDRFLYGNSTGRTSDAFAIGYYLEKDIAFLPSMVKAYTLYDRWFCSIMASTFVNRHFQLSAQSGGTKTNALPTPPAIPLKVPIGFQWETILDRALSRGVSVGYYVSDLPVPALYGARGLPWIRPMEEFYADAALGRLPQIAFVDPPFRDGGGGNGVSADEHPHGDMRLGQAFMADVVNAFTASRQYRRGALFVNYDEWGGFFDHVPPPRVPDDRANTRNISDDFGLMGFRVPAVAVSPFTRGGRVEHTMFGHESILKLMSYRFGLGDLNTRHRYAANVGMTFDFTANDIEPPSLPTPHRILSVPCAAGGASGPLARAVPHDLESLETSGLLERLHYEVKPVTLASIFREPDRLRRALRESA